jgi:phosphohistidine phosphatase SixA
VRKGRTHALLNSHASKKRKLENAAYNSEKEAMLAEIERLTGEVQKLSSIPQNPPNT